MTRMNKATCAKCPSNRFITFFFCVLDAATGELAFANAGHNPPILVRASGEAEMLEGGGPVLGILAAPYCEERAHLDPGDMLVIYSDGVTEAHNPALTNLAKSASSMCCAASPEPAAALWRRLPRRLPNSPPARRRRTISRWWWPSGRGARVCRGKGCRTGAPGEEGSGARFSGGESGYFRRPVGYLKTTLCHQQKNSIVSY